MLDDCDSNITGASQNAKQEILKSNIKALNPGYVPLVYDIRQNNIIHLNEPLTALRDLEDSNHFSIQTSPIQVFV